MTNPISALTRPLIRARCFRRAPTQCSTLAFAAAQCQKLTLFGDALFALASAAACLWAAFRAFALIDRHLGRIA